MPNAQIKSAEHARQFILAGNARVTFVSTKSGTRFTYRVRKTEGGTVSHFVSVLTGPDNSNDYQYLGHIFAAQDYCHGKKSKISLDAPSARAFAWAFKNLQCDALEIWHEGKCGRCGRALTVPESIALGIGPECASKMGA